MTSVSKVVTWNGASGAYTLRRKRNRNMPEWLKLVAIIAAYIVVTQWLLPKLGVPT